MSHQDIQWTRIFELALLPSPHQSCPEIIEADRSPDQNKGEQ